MSSYTVNTTYSYFNQISRIPLLSYEEEQELGALIAKGDKTARNKLIESNLRLVVSVAKHYSRNTQIAFIDLVQEGNVGLVKAVDKWDYSLGYKFSTYATWWIKQYISRAIVERSRAIRLPSYVISQLGTVNKIEQELYQQLKRQPTNAEIAKQSELSEKRVRELRAIVKDPISIDMTVGNEDDTPIGDLIADEDEISPVEELHQERINKTIQKVLETLDGREVDILSQRYGLNGGSPRTLDEIGTEYHLSKERVRQIEENALRKLRNPIRANILRECLED